MGSFPGHDRTSADLTLPWVVRFRAGDLRRVRRVISAWAAAAGLRPAQVDDFVLAVGEIASNAVRHGSPLAQLMLSADVASVAAEVGDSGRWRPGAVVVSPTGRGGMGLLLAHLLCDDVGIHAMPEGTRVRLRMMRPSPRGDPGMAGRTAGLAAEPRPAPASIPGSHDDYQARTVNGQ